MKKKVKWGKPLRGGYVRREKTKKEGDLSRQSDWEVQKKALGGFVIEPRGDFLSTREGFLRGCNSTTKVSQRRNYLLERTPGEFEDCE